MTTPREAYGKVGYGGLYKGMYTTLDTINGMADRKQVSYSALESAVKGENLSYKTTKQSGVYDPIIGLIY